MVSLQEVGLSLEAVALCSVPSLLYYWYHVAEHSAYKQALVVELALFWKLNKS